VARSALDLALSAVRRFVADGMSERAPAIAYYAILSIFPALLLMFGALRFVGGDDAPQDIAAYASDHGASGALADALRSAVTSAREAPAPAAGGAGALGAVTTLYGASRAFTATGRALDAMDSDVRTGRSLRRRAQDLACTLLVLLGGLIVLLLLLVSGDVLSDALELIGISDGATTLYSAWRWVAVAVLSLLLVATIRWAAPSAPRPPLRLRSAGVLLTVTALLLEAAGFNFYLTTIAHYDATYGTFTAAVILMVWVWMGSATLLAGAEVDEVLEGRRRHRSGPGDGPGPASPGLDDARAGGRGEVEAGQ
jgi:membrane protein